MRRMEVISGPERRRRWSEEQKLAIVAEAFVPDDHDGLGFSEWGTST
jgi:transposase-like protein